VLVLEAICAWGGTHLPVSESLVLNRAMSDFRPFPNVRDG